MWNTWNNYGRTLTGLARRGTRGVGMPLFVIAALLDASNILGIYDPIRVCRKFPYSFSTSLRRRAGHIFKLSCNANVSQGPILRSYEHS